MPSLRQVLAPDGLLSGLLWCSCSAQNYEIDHAHKKWRDETKPPGQCMFDLAPADQVTDLAKRCVVLCVPPWPLTLMRDLRLAYAQH